MGKLSMFAAGVVMAMMLAGCSSGPHAKMGFATVEKGGKLYVFPYGSEEYKAFVEEGKISKPVTAIGAGPNGETVVSNNEVVLHRYLGW